MHELTRKIDHPINLSREQWLEATDTFIVRWLEKKVVELNVTDQFSYCQCGKGSALMPASQIREILGLSTAEPGSVKSVEDVPAPSRPVGQDKTWCTHILPEPEANGGWYFLPREGGCAVFDWDICPVKGCHAPRPEPKKTLAERMNEACGWSNQVDFNIAADVAKAWFREMVEGVQITGDGPFSTGERCFKSTLLRRLEERE